MKCNWSIGVPPTEHVSVTLPSKPTTFKTQSVRGSIVWGIFVHVLVQIPLVAHELSSPQHFHGRRSVTLNLKAMTLKT